VAGLTAEHLVAGWRRAGVEPGMHVIVHASLSSLGPVRGGATTVVESLLAAVGATGTTRTASCSPRRR
jgi:aminoglycoside 3-N-acetyltransferase